MHMEATRVNEPPFYTGAQAQVSIGSAIVFTALNVGWNESFEHTPYHGYRSQLYDHVFPGKSLVIGTLLLNLMDTQLLDVVCSEGYHKTHADLAPKQTLQTGQGGEIVRTPTDPYAWNSSRESWSRPPIGEASDAFRQGNNDRAEDLTEQIIAATDDMRSASQLLEEIKVRAMATAGPEPAVPINSAIRTLRWLQHRQRFGIDVHVNIGDYAEMGKSWADRKYSTAETIKNLIFTGQNRQIQTGTDVIIQAYSFIAREVIPQ